MRHDRWVVDRIEGSTAVLVADSTDPADAEPTGSSPSSPRSSARAVEDPREAVAEIPTDDLPAGVREGWVLVVPRSNEGTPRWAEATRDEEEERRRLEEARRILDELEGRDEGGDVEL